MMMMLILMICNHYCKKRNGRREYHLHRCNSLQIHIDRMMFCRWHRNCLPVVDWVVRHMHRLNNQLFVAQSGVPVAAVVTAPQPPMSHHPLLPNQEFEPALVVVVVCVVPS